MDERREDWRHGVDENLVSLNAAQRVTDNQLDELDLRYKDIDNILRGNPENKEDGLIAEVHAIDIKVNNIRAELFRIKQSFSDETHERREDRRINWGNITKIIVAIITSGAIALFWKDIRAYVEKYNKPMIVKTRRRKARHLRVIIQQPAPIPQDPEN